MNDNNEIEKNRICKILIINFVTTQLSLKLCANEAEKDRNNAISPAGGGGDGIISP